MNSFANIIHGFTRSHTDFIIFYNVSPLYIAEQQQRRQRQQKESERGRKIKLFMTDKLKKKRREGIYALEL
jgi:hypothetical protein